MRIENVLQVEDPSGFKYYLGVITPTQIMELTFVPCVVRVNENILNIRTESGYQREGDAKRMRKIKEFYQAHPDSLVPPVLLSTRGEWKFTPIKAGSTFGHIEAEDQAAIIDGQHRLGGLSLMAQDGTLDSSARSRSIPFMAVAFGSIEEEANEFEVINDEQKGIKKSHLRFIRRTESFAGNAATMLKDDEESVFCSRIAISTRSDWDLITFGALVELVDLTFDTFFMINTGFRPQTDDEHQAKAMQFLIDYWRLVSQVFGVMWEDINLMPPNGTPKNSSYPGRGRFKYRVLEETGLRALAKLGSKILHRSWISTSEEVSWDQAKRLLSVVAADEKVNLVLQKLKADNRAEILAIDAQLQFQGIAGVSALYRVLEGALDRL